MAETGRHGSHRLARLPDPARRPGAAADRDIRCPPMTKIHYLFFVVLIGGGVGLSVLLVPGKGELALIHFKDKEYEVACRSYEERLSSGNRSIDVVIPLTQLYLQFGEVEKAVQLMEEFVRDNPN